MAMHTDVVFAVRGGQAWCRGDYYGGGDEDDEDDDEYLAEEKGLPLNFRVVAGDEFKDKPDGWYWQHRRIRAFEHMGTGFGPVSGPFKTQDEAREHANAKSDESGSGRLIADYFKRKD